MQRHDAFLRMVKFLLIIASIIYFLCPILFQAFVKKGYIAHPPQVLTNFFSSSIFAPVMSQYNTAVVKNNPIYYLAFWVCLILICAFSWMIAFWIVRTIYNAIKR